ncbi:MAG: hydroxymethylbilane synthase [Sphingomonadaceae bacterium]
MIKPSADAALLRIGTRGSPLALAQARMTAEALERVGGSPAPAIETIVIQTTGDRVQDRALAEIGGKALWTRELDRALIAGEVDAAVHSMKDVETRLAPGLVLAAVLPRADVRDRLIGAPSLAALRPGARVGTSSPRRAAQLKHRRPDVEPVLLRGNVETRLRAVAEERVDATFLAAAGLERLGIAEGVALPVEDWLPAASQGVVGITCRADDSETRARLAAISHAGTLECLLAERALLDGLGGSCRTSVAALAVAIDADPEGAGGRRIELRAELLSPDGRDCVGERAIGPATDPEALGRTVAERLLARATSAIRASLETLAAPERPGA